MTVLRSFVKIVDHHTAAVTLASLIATYLCIAFDYALELPDGLIAIAVVFPLGFAINAAFGRREKALDSYAAMKASAAALFLAHRDWLPERPSASGAELRQITVDIFEDVQRLLASAQPAPELLGRVYAGFARLSECNEQLRAAGVSASELARAHEYVHTLVGHFERLRNIRHYRTPASLRAYAKLFLNIMPLLFAPHFAYLATLHTPLVGYVVAGVYSVILVSLDNIQDALENPFDALGEDDIMLDAVADYQHLVTAASHPPDRQSLEAALPRAAARSATP